MFWYMNARMSTQKHTDIKFRRAAAEDLPAIVALLADDPLGATREHAGDGALDVYKHAFDEIAADPNQYLVVVQDGGDVIGTLQLTFIPCLSRGGAKRGQIEAVRIAPSHRGQGIGEAMFSWAIDECRARGCSLVQLTTDKSRADAHRFYAKLGFEPSHIGYKLFL